MVNGDTEMINPTEKQVFEKELEGGRMMMKLWWTRAKASFQKKEFEVDGDVWSNFIKDSFKSL